MPKTNPLSNPTEEPLENRATGGYGMYGKTHESSQIEIGNKDNGAPTIFPGSGSNPSNGSIKRLIKTTGGV